MPRFEPFVGLRYADQTAMAELTAPPYDVVDRAQRAELAARSPHNVIHVDLPSEDEGPGRYAAAARRFDDWRATGVLVADPSPTFTGYRMNYRDDRGRPAHTLGVIGALELSHPGEGDILPHEHTTPKARSDRLDLLRATHANLSAVWVLSLTEGLSDLLGPGDAEVTRWTDGDVVHETWVIADRAATAAIAEAVAASPVVVADGHHRYETSLTYLDQDRDHGAHRMMTYVVELVEDQLTVGPIHRLVHEVPSVDALVAAVEPTLAAGEVVAADDSVTVAMAEAGAMAVVRPDGRAQLVHPRPGAFDGVPDLDSARLDAALASVEHRLEFQHGVAEVVDAVGTGRAAAGVLLRPATVAQIAANAHTGERMPPKTTFFHPKPRTGVVFRALGEA